MIVDQDMLKLVRKNSLFNSLNPSLVDSLIKPKNFFTAKEGELIYSYEEAPKELYLIAEGEVKMKFYDKKNIQYKYLLDFFGEKEILDKTNRVSSAIANKDCILYKLDADEVTSLITNHEDLNNNLLKINPNSQFDISEPALAHL